jgi:hypothetical protein
MPKKPTGEKMEKVISTKISVEVFDLLQRYARVYYNRNVLQQPNMSHMLRWILESWTTLVRENEKNATNNRDGKKHLDSIGLIDLRTIGGIPFKF